MIGAGLIVELWHTSGEGSMEFAAMTLIFAAVLIALLASDQQHRNR